jgi:WD40 repeat protein
MLPSLSSVLLCVYVLGQEPTPARVLTPRKIQGEESFGGILSAAFSSDKRRLAAGTDHGTLLTWELKNGTEVFRRKGASNGLWNVLFSAGDDRIIFAGEGGPIDIASASDGRKVCSLAGHKQATSLLALDPETSDLVSYGRDRMVRVWDLRTRKEKWQWRPDGPEGVFGLGCALGERGIVISRRRYVYALDRQNKREPQVLPGVSGKLSLSLDGRILALTGDSNQLDIYDRVSRTMINPIHCAGVILAFAFVSDNLVAVGMDSGGRTPGTLIVYDWVNDHVVTTISGFSSKVTCLAASEDGQLLCSGHDDSSLRIWELAKLKRSKQKDRKSVV